MKYAFMTFSCPHLTLDELLATARRYGYDGIEPRTAVKHGHGIELDATAADRRDIRRKAVDSGIALCSIATSCAYANPATSKQMVDDTLRYIDLADDVGSPAIRVFGGTIPHDVSREHAIDAVAQALQSVADHAQQRNIAVCVETHDDWCTPRDRKSVV